MSALKENLASQIDSLREDAKAIITACGDEKLSEVKVAQAFGGMRGVTSLICDTSEVSPETGLLIRGIPILELTNRLPEEIFWLLLTGETPDEGQMRSLHEDFISRSEVPDYVYNMLATFPLDSHPMAMLNAALLSLERESVFRKRYFEGMSKDEYWEAALEDGLNLIAKIPAIAAAVYRIRYEKGGLIPSQAKLGWGANFARMLGIDAPEEEFAKFMNLYLTLHSDHEGGNVSAFSCATVGSALSDPYYAVSAGLNGLAGPLHGLANQGCLRFVQGINERYHGVPTDEQLVEYAWETLNSGKVIPGYGHAVLRCPDPRFIAFHQFADKHFKDDPLMLIVDKIYRLIPDVLREQGKAKNPFPNVDAISGSLLYQYGISEFRYYTVMFAVSRALGLVAQLVLNRAVGMPITRPKSVTSAFIKSKFSPAVKV